MSKLRAREKAAVIVRDAGGEIIGRTKLQKVAYLLNLAGFGNDFSFKYRHYGPYSEDLSEAIHSADVFGLITEDERPTKWGGFYSIFKFKNVPDAKESDEALTKFTTKLALIDAVELELAATAAYISSVEKLDDPWSITEERKPDKAANQRLEKAKKSYKELLEFSVPNPLPRIV